MNTQTKLIDAIKDFAFAKQHAANTNASLLQRATYEQHAENHLKQMIKLMKEWK